MHFTSQLLGSFEFDPEHILTFPSGLPAFEHCTRFKLFHQADSLEPQIFWLQSLDQPELMFNLTDPERLGVHYDLALSATEVDTLQLQSCTDIALLVMVYKEGERGEEPAALASLRANLRNPLLINLASRRGLQKTGLACDIVFRN